MLAPVSLRSQFPALYGATMLPALEEVFTFEYEQLPLVRDRLFRNVTARNGIYQVTQLLDMPLFERVPEGTEYSFKRPAVGANTTLIPDKFGMGYAISREMVEDGKFDLVGMMMRKLARSARESQEVSAMSIFNGAFTTSVSDDGLSLINSAHLIGNSNYSNQITGNPDLSESSLQAALAQWERAFVGNTGIIYRMRPRYLVVSSENRRYAAELVGSDLKPDTGDNNLNSIRTIDGLEVVASPYLTDPDAWFIMADPEDTGLYIATSQGIQTVAGDPTNVGFLNDSYVYKASYREVVGLSTAMGIMGSDGSGG